MTNIYYYPIVFTIKDSLSAFYRERERKFETLLPSIP